MSAPHPGPLPIGWGEGVKYFVLGTRGGALRAYPGLFSCTPLGCSKCVIREKLLSGLWEAYQPEFNELLNKTLIAKKKGLEFGSFQDVSWLQMFNDR